MWICQEIGTEARAQLFWGDAVCDWDALGQLCVTLDELFPLLRKRFNVASVTVRYLYRRFVRIGSRSRQNFVFELHRARDRHASDPRDYIYALLGHYSALIGPEKKPIMEADYGLSMEEVNHTVAYRMFIEENYVSTLNAVQHAYDHGTSFRA
jgi:hypothetical protein